MRLRTLTATLAASATLALTTAAFAQDQSEDDREAIVAAAQAEAIPMSVSINEMMVAFMDFAADGIWRPAARDELSDAEWLLVEQESVRLMLAATLTTMPGEGVNDLEWIADPDWRRYANEMRVLGFEARQSAQDHDMARLRLVGDRLVEVCQACHQDFKPDLPVMGYTRLPEITRDLD